MARQHAGVQRQGDIAANGGNGDDEDNEGFCASVFHNRFQSVFSCNQYVPASISRMFVPPHKSAVRGFPLTETSAAKDQIDTSMSFSAAGEGPFTSWITTCPASTSVDSSPASALEATP